MTSDNNKNNLREYAGGELRKAEDRGRTAEGLLMERLEGESGSEKVLENAKIDWREERNAGTAEAAWATKTAGDKERAEGRAGCSMASLSSVGASYSP